MEFGEKLRAKREEKGMTQQTLADQLYVTRQAVSKWESGSRYPDLMTTKCIASILGTTIDSLVSDDEMKEFSEKQAIYGGMMSGKIMAALYLLTAIISIVNMLPEIINGIYYLLYSDYSSIFGDESRQIVIVVVNMVRDIIIAGIGFWGFFASVRKEVDAKVAGYLGIIYYLREFIAYIATLVILQESKGSLLVLIMLTIAMTFIVFEYFIKKKNRYAKLVYAGCTICMFMSISIQFYTIVYCMKYMESWDKYSVAAPVNASRAIANAIFMFLIIMQTVFLERKRKLCGIK